MRRALFALSFTLLSAPAVQAQPISWGMAQCSALMGVMAQYVSQQPQKGYLTDASETLFHAAVSQSQAEGRNPEELTDVKAQKRDAWLEMGFSMAFKQEFRDWTDYCRSLSRSHNIALHKSMLN